MQYFCISAAMQYFCIFVPVQYFCTNTILVYQCNISVPVQYFGINTIFLYQYNISVSIQYQYNISSPTVSRYVSSHSNAGNGSVGTTFAFSYAVYLCTNTVSLYQCNFSVPMQYFCINTISLLRQLPETTGT